MSSKKRRKIELGENGSAMSHTLMTQTSRGLFKEIKKLIKIAKRQRQNEKLLKVLKESNKCRNNGKFERKLLAEMEKGKKLEVELKKLLESETEPEETTLTERLTERYYEPVTPQIVSLTTFHSGSILVQKVFDQMSNENVVCLVKALLSSPAQHKSLNQLHYSFDNRYWKQRYETVCQTSYLFEQIESPVSELGLVHFADLLIRHQNLLERKSKIVKFSLDELVIYDDMFGNNYFLSVELDQVELGQIVGKFDSISLVKSICTVGSGVDYRFLLFEPFLLRHDDESSPFDFEVSFLPSSPDNFETGFKADETEFELPDNVEECGNFEHSTRRILPAISKKIETVDEHYQKEIITIHLIELGWNKFPVGRISVKTKSTHVIGEGIFDNRIKLRKAF